MVVAAPTDQDIAEFAERAVLVHRITSRNAEVARVAVHQLIHAFGLCATTIRVSDHQDRLRRALDRLISF